MHNDDDDDDKVDSPAGPSTPGSPAAQPRPAAGRRQVVIALGGKQGAQADLITAEWALRYFLEPGDQVVVVHVESPSGLDSCPELGGLSPRGGGGCPSPRGGSSLRGGSTRGGERSSFDESPRPGPAAPPRRMNSATWPRWLPSEIWKAFTQRLAASDLTFLSLQRRTSLSSFLFDALEVARTLTDYANSADMPDGATVRILLLGARSGRGLLNRALSGTVSGNVVQAARVATCVVRGALTEPELSLRCSERLFGRLPRRIALGLDGSADCGALADWAARHLLRDSDRVMLAHMPAGYCAEDAETAAARVAACGAAIAAALPRLQLSVVILERRRASGQDSAFLALSAFVEAEVLLDLLVVGGSSSSDRSDKMACPSPREKAVCSSPRPGQGGGGSGGSVGSTFARLVRDSACPVLVVPRCAFVPLLGGGGGGGGAAAGLLLPVELEAGQAEEEFAPSSWPPGAAASSSAASLGGGLLPLRASVDERRRPHSRVAPTSYDSSQSECGIINASVYDNWFRVSDEAGKTLEETWEMGANYAENKARASAAEREQEEATIMAEGDVTTSSGHPLRAAALDWE